MLLLALPLLTAAVGAPAADVHYDLAARMNGSHTLSDGTQVDTWGFRLGGGMGGIPQVPGPVIHANEGDRVFLNFRNMSMMPHTIHPHGLDVDQQNDGVPQTSFEVPMMGSYTYEFIAPHAGSYNYHCHVETILHLQMGMYGAINIMPPDGSNHAWNGGPAFDVERSWITAEIDLDWNQLQESADFTVYEPDYFLVNGRDGVHVAADPYTTFDIAGTEIVLLRLSNMGYLPVRYDFGGLWTEVVASDGRPLPESHGGDGLEIAPGERYDVLVRGVAAGAYLVTLEYIDLYDRGIRGTAEVPVTVSGGQTEVSAETPTLPFRVSQPFPSPFEQRVSFDVDVYRPDPLDIWIFDVRGRTLMHRRFVETVNTEISWDGTDLAGRSLPSGVYYLRARQGDGFVNRRMTLLR